MTENRPIGVSILGILGLLAAALVAPVQAAILHVPGDAASIQGAINIASPSDTVRIGQGTYNERIYIIGLENLTIEGAGTGKTIIQNENEVGQPPAFYIRKSTGIHIANLTVEGSQVGVVITARDPEIPDDPGTPSEVVFESCDLNNFGVVGFFVGTPGCANLSPGSAAVPPCFLEHRERYVDGSSLVLRNCTLSYIGKAGEYRGTGIVFYPGTSGLVEGTYLANAHLTGLFAWGADVDLTGSTFDGNVEHAVEYRQYPSPKTKSGFILKATGTLSGNTIKNSRPLPNGSLGGGVVTQAADISLVGNTITSNTTLGICADNKSRLTLEGNTISGNGQAGVVIKKGSRVIANAGNTLADNGFEGFCAMGNTYLEMTGSTVRGNGRHGVVLQKNSELHITDSVITGNGKRGTAANPYGGIALRWNSWGSVTDSEISGHEHGPGVIYYGGPREFFVDGNNIHDNLLSGVSFNGTTATGTVVGNTFGGNQPWDLTCPGNGKPYIGDPAAFGGSRDASCSPPPNQYLTVPPMTSLEVSSAQRLGTGKKFSAFVSSSRPAAAAMTSITTDGISGVTAYPAAAKRWYLPNGDATPGHGTSIAIFNPNRVYVNATLTFYTEGGSVASLTKTVQARKKILVTPPAGVAGQRFSIQVAASKPVLTELRVTSTAGVYAGQGTAATSNVWYFARGHCAENAVSRVALHDPSGAANVTFTYTTPTGGSISRDHQVGPSKSLSVDVLDDLDAHVGDFSLKISSSQLLAAAMMTEYPDGLEGGLGSPVAASGWYLPLGSTAGGHETLIHLANPGSESVRVGLAFHVGNPGTPQVEHVSLAAGEVTSLAASQYLDADRSFGVTATCDQPVLVSESVGDPAGDGLEIQGASELVYRGYFADGSTLDDGDTLLRFYNPGQDPLSVRLIYYLSR